MFTLYTGQLLRKPYRTHSQGLLFTHIKNGDLGAIESHIGGIGVHTLNDKAIRY